MWAIKLPLDFACCRYPAAFIRALIPAPERVAGGREYRRDRDRLQR